MAVAVMLAGKSEIWALVKVLGSATSMESGCSNRRFISDLWPCLLSKYGWATVSLSIQACTCFRRGENQGRGEGINYYNIKAVML